MRMAMEIDIIEETMCDLDLLNSNMLELIRTGAVELMEGQDLIKDSDMLVGVPLYVLGGEMRESVSFVHPENGEMKQDYVSLDILTASDEVYLLRGVQRDLLPMQAWPNNRVVWNDGSTGANRQIMAKLVKDGYIELPDPVVVNGAKGDSSYDLPVDAWTGVNKGTILTREDGRHFYRFTFEKPLACLRGLRFSEFPNPVKPKEMARVYYLA